MSEAVELRVKKGRVTDLLQMALFLWVAGCFALYLGLFGFESPKAIVTFGSLAITLFASGTFMVATWRANMHNGWLRVGFERLFGEFADPPLNDWEDRLEAKNAFGGDDE